MAELIDLLENSNLDRKLSAKNGLRRDILRIFTKWGSKPLTANKIYQILKDDGHDIKMDTLYDNLEALIKKSILYKKQLPSHGKRERPSYEYKLRTGAVYELFKLTEDLVDAMGFAKLETIDSNTYVTKIVFRHDDSNKLESLYSTSGGIGGFSIFRKPADKEDLEKTWRLEQHILELQSFCSLDNPKYRDYAASRDVQSDEVEEKYGGHL